MARRNGNLNLAHIFPIPIVTKQQPEKRVEVKLVIPANKLRAILALLEHGDRIQVVKS